MRLNGSYLGREYHPESENESKFTYNLSEPLREFGFKDKPWYQEYFWDEACTWIRVQTPTEKFTTFRPIDWLYSYRSGAVDFQNMFSRLQQLVNDLMPLRPDTSEWNPSDNVPFEVGADNGVYDQLSITYEPINCSTFLSADDFPEVITATATWRDRDTDEEPEYKFQIGTNGNPKTSLFSPEEILDIPPTMHEIKPPTLQVPFY